MQYFQYNDVNCFYKHNDQVVFIESASLINVVHFNCPLCWGLFAEYR